MCGIAGYSLDSSSTVDRTRAAQALLAGIAERGADAVGYAYTRADATAVVQKQQTGASELLHAISVPEGTDRALVHVRDFTKGHPDLLANNHPIRHGAVVGIHNGIIENDDELFARHALTRAEPGMTVDSEAIFALMELTRSEPAALEQLRGSLATAWIDERDPTTLHLARGVARPLWLGVGRAEVFFASTRAAIVVVERTLRLSLRKREVAEGTYLALRHGRTAERTRFTPDRSYRDRTPLPVVRAPNERASCLAWLTEGQATA
jgi:glucosamine--fructose-6-phosphate aminotransferase (isomerizing)